MHRRIFTGLLPTITKPRISNFNLNCKFEATRGNNLAEALYPVSHNSGSLIDYCKTKVERTGILPAEKGVNMSDGKRAFMESDFADRNHSNRHLLPSRSTRNHRRDEARLAE